MNTKRSAAWLRTQQRPLFPQTSRGELREAWGSFLSEISWDRFCSATFRVEPSIDVARQEVDKWIRRINMRVPRGAGYFWVIEGGTEGKRVHVHVLTCFTEAIAPTEMEKLWFAGRIEVHEYRHGSPKGAYYVTKMTDDDDTEWGFSSRLRWKRPR